jgi:hypothetical protein
MIEPRQLTPPPDPLPGQSRLRRRLAGRPALRDDLLFRLATTPDPARPGRTLGDTLDVEGDPAVLTVAELWARVADGVCAYAEMTTGEIYLGTAQDWTDVRRIVDLAGYRPAQRTAAHGWIRADTAPGASPLVPVGTQVQAPGTPSHPAQTYEVSADTQLRADWAGLTVTGVPVPAAPAEPNGNQLRFLQDPGFSPSDRVVFVSETGAQPFPTNWADFLVWLFALIMETSYIGATGQSVLGTARVTKRSDDLGAVLLEFDRSLVPLLPQASGTSYAAYRVRAELAVPSRLDALSYASQTTTKTTTETTEISGTTTTITTTETTTTTETAATTPVTYPSSEPFPYGSNSVLVTDGSQVSPGQLLILYGEPVLPTGQVNECLVTTVISVTPLDWHVAPGTVKRVAMVSFGDPLPTDLIGQPLTVLLADPRQAAQHYKLPDLQPGDTAARLHPRPGDPPQRLAVQTQSPLDGSLQWELTGCTKNAGDSPNDPGGMLVNLTGTRSGTISRGSATGNVIPVQHGTTSQGPVTLAGGTAVLTGPVTGDVATDGTVTDSLVLRVGGVRWDEVASLYGRTASDQVYATRLAADGRLVLLFGDGVTGARPLGAVTASWRVGGGLAGEVPATEITSLLGAVNGVRKIAGVGALSGAADQEDPLRMRRAAAARIRALDRAVALPDLADLALTVPGTSHSVSWRGAGPPGCACGGSGLHVAVLRLAASGTGAPPGVRAPSDAELRALGGYLDARRDTTVPVCVCAAVPSPVEVGVLVAVDLRRDPKAVLAAMETALTDPAGPLAPLPRELGEPLDGSDVIEIAQPVPGVVGITGLFLAGGLSPVTNDDLSLGRLPAQRYELLYVGNTFLGVGANG